MTVTSIRMSRRSRTLSIMCLLGAVGCSGYATSVAIAQEYHVVSVPFISGTIESNAVGIDQNGWVTGDFTKTNGDSWGYRYPSGGGNFQLLNPLAGDTNTFVFGSGLVGLTCGLSDNTPVQWLNDNAPKEIAPGEGILSANGSNFIGHVTGHQLVSLIETQAYLWTSTNGVTMLGTLGTGEDSNGADVNRSDHVTGWSEISPGSAPRAFKWDATNGMLDLGTVNNDIWSFGVAINDKNQVLCHSINIIPSRFSSFIWDNGARTIVPKLNNQNTFLNAINNNGQAVGYSVQNLQPVAIMYYGGQVVDLNDLISPAAGWLLTEATGINDEGLICGTGIHNSTTQAFVLRPNYSNGAVIVPNAVDKKAYVFDPEGGHFLGTFGISFANWPIELIDSKGFGQSADMLLSDNISGDLHALVNDGSRIRTFNGTPEPGIRGIAKSINDFYVGATPTGFVAWDGSGNKQPDATAGDFMDIIMLELPNQRYYVMTELGQDNIEGYKLSLNFVGQSKRNGIPGPRQITTAFNQKYYLVAGFDGGRVYALKLNNVKPAGSFNVNGNPMGVVQLNDNTILVTTTNGVYQFNQSGQPMRTVLSGSGFQYANHIQNYQPF